ncbi:MAG: 2-hydroxyglutaryl-CoA dehydratase [Lachnospiraceae bacterium]|nr:2-hydroxyglutaryl-CoA dehydratase [Lachnospiraceae bacterium]
MKIGIDVGSTTIKCVVLDELNNIIYRSYERHFAMIVEKTVSAIRAAKERFNITEPVSLSISGSAGMGLAEWSGVPFVQEVYATKVAVNSRIPDTDVVIELGGEDAKILFLQGNLEVRMNGSCAGGTGAFADQMANLLDVTVDEMNDLAKDHDKIYTIASRCGVFAKTDVQPLLNQGARKSDIAASILYSIVNQTVTGLAQGHPITGKIVYLGGPLTFMSELRKSFDDTLKCEGICPEDSLYFVALGAALYSDAVIDLDEALEKMEKFKTKTANTFLPALFEDEKEYEAFKVRHAKDTVPVYKDYRSFADEAYLGIDAGSTTLKIVLTDKNGKIVYSKYSQNKGNPIDVIREFLLEVYETIPDMKIVSSAVTGYGEEMIKNALCIDNGVVETIAHFTAAKKFMPDVEFIIDIGGQDMKCFKIRNGAIDNIFLNEACSSGCGSFLQTFASSMGYEIEDFAEKGLFAKNPVDLGSRCTVFMNSSVKQAQKDGATVEDISAGLSISVIKNALYKVIRAHSPEELGKKIVVQGGTFYNNAVLRAFEQEMGVDVIRPDIAGLMGAYGAALYAQENSRGESTLLGADALKDFTYTVKAVTCNGCNNHCKLTINDFNGRKFVGGNQCELPVSQKVRDTSLDIYSYKLELLDSYKPKGGTRGRIGIPMGLNMYEMLPFWHAFFTSLGFEVVMSGFSNRETYLRGQGTIPSDTVCFPAKMLHGHIQKLIDDGIENIFYPCMTYNFDEKAGDNHYNCPVVAYYPEVIEANVPELSKVNYIMDYVGPHRAKDFPKKMHGIMCKYFSGINLRDVQKAADEAYREYDSYMSNIKKKGQEIIEKARSLNKKIIVLVGRPYHVDPEISHGIHKLITSLGLAVISEDCLPHPEQKFRVGVLNQWTYHSRLYSAAKYVCDENDMYVIQLVSFGCGVDAITTDEVRMILEHNNKLYTQIKIDEITNLGAVKIRVRSLLAAIEYEERRR